MHNLNLQTLRILPSSQIPPKVIRHARLHDVELQGCGVTGHGGEGAVAVEGVEGVDDEEVLGTVGDDAVGELEDEVGWAIWVGDGVGELVGCCEREMEEGEKEDGEGEEVAKHFFLVSFALLVVVVVVTMPCAVS